MVSTLLRSKKATSTSRRMALSRISTRKDGREREASVMRIRMLSSLPP